MSGQTNQWELFGFDLSKLAGFLRLGCRQILFDRSSWLARTLQPALLLRDNQGWSAWTAAGRFAISPEDIASLEKNGQELFFAAEIPSDSVLFKTIWLPESEETLLAQAVELEASALSPFSDDERIIGWSIIRRVAGAMEIAIAISNKRFAESARETWLLDHGADVDSSDLTICAVHHDHLIIFPAYESPARDALYVSRLKSVVAKSGAIVACVALALALPVASSAYRAGQLQEQSDSMRNNASMVDEVISSLHRQRARTDFLVAEISSRPDYAQRLDSVAAATPDDTFLESLRMSEAQVEVTGYSKNAASYLRSLTEEKQFTNVNARSAFLREQRSGLERFSIDWVFESEPE